MTLDNLLYGLVAIFLGGCMGVGIGLGMKVFDRMFNKYEKELDLSR